MTIKTAGDLRAFLADILVGIKNGTVDTAQAAAISKVSAQINQSLATEVGAAIQLHKLGKDRPSAGSLALASNYNPDVTKPVEDGGGIWCDQCDMRVSPEQADGCKSKFCKAK